MRSNLLVYTENYQRGGGNKYSISVINNLATVTNEILFVVNRYGIFPEEEKQLKSNVIVKKVIMFSSSGLYNYQNNFQYQGIIFKFLFRLLSLILSPVFFSYQILLFLIMLLRTRPKQVIIFNGGYPGAGSCQILAIVARLFTRNISMSIVSMPVGYKRTTKFFAYLLDVLVWKACKFIVTNCESSSNALIIQRALPASKEKRVLFNGIDDIAEPSVKKLKTQRQTEIIIGYVGRIESSKGIMLIMEAFKKICHEQPNAKLHIYGDGPEMYLLSENIKIYGLENTVKVFGHHNGEIAKIFDHMDIYVLPSYREGLSYSLLEAMRAGVAIIATNVGGATEAIENMKSGIIVPMGSVDSLSDGLTLLILNEGLRASLGSEARKVFSHNFKSDNFKSNSIKVFRPTY
jgi:glycosyltransferase involved in cell wall biosynthesis